MNTITITLNDDDKIDELLALVSALPYVESASCDDPPEAVNGVHDLSLTDLDREANRDYSPFYQDPNTQLMDKEIAAFEEMKTELIAKHLGQYVAIHQGKVVDYDSDKALLRARVARVYPQDVVLIRQVRQTPRPPFRLRSPRLNRN
ncbi:MAG: hypothetical protein R2911_19635 [Caldilineaceae bacterium]